MLSGDWTAFEGPGCNAGVQKTLAAPFVNNQISPALYDPAALNIVKTLPQTSNPCGAYSFVQPLHQNEYQFVGKIDFQQSAKNTLFGRYIRTTLTQVPAYDLVNSPLATTV